MTDSENILDRLRALNAQLLAALRELVEKHERNSLYDGSGNWDRARAAIASAQQHEPFTTCNHPSGARGLTGCSPDNHPYEYEALDAGHEALARAAQIEAQKDARIAELIEERDELQTEVYTRRQGQQMLEDDCDELRTALAYLVNAHDATPDRRGILTDVPAAIERAREVLGAKVSPQ